MNDKNAQNSVQSPYVGLTPFAESNARYFFGRQADIENAATNLRSVGLTIFYGASGVGKSSLINAGVVPYLQKIATSSILPGDLPEFLLIVVRDWANDPMGSLRLSIAAAAKKALKLEAEKKLTLTFSQADVDKPLEANAADNDLSALLQNLSGLVKSNLLIILDQFEEFFSNAESANAENKDKYLIGEESFGRQLSKVLNSKMPSVNFMISMRDDGLSKLDYFAGQTPDLMSNCLRLNHLSFEDARLAIDQPLGEFNKIQGMQTAFSVDPQLREKLLVDLEVGKIRFDMPPDAAGGQPPADKSAAPAAGQNGQIETPYLQLVLTRLWNKVKDEKSADKQIIKQETLDGEGDVANIVKTHLDDAMDKLSETEKIVASKFIHFTVSVSGAKRSSTVDDLALMIDTTNISTADIENILKKLMQGDKRIFREVPNRSNRQKPFYEITHDALGPAILSWRKRENDAIIQRAIQQNEEAKRKQEIADMEAARQAELEEEKRQKEMQAVKLKEEQERSLFQEKLLAAERKNRKTGRTAFIVGLILLIIAGFAGFEWYREYKDKIAERAINSKRFALQNDQVELENENTSLKEDTERVSVYKALIPILADLQSENPKKIGDALKQLDEKAKAGQIPEEYKTLIADVVKNKKISPQDDKTKEAALTSIENSKATIGLPKPGPQAIIFIQIQNADDGAEKLRKSLKANNYSAPGIENVGPQPEIKQTQLRYFRKGDLDLAKKICTFLGQYGVQAVPLSVPGYEESPLIRPNQFELWFTGDPINFQPSPQSTTAN